MSNYLKIVVLFYCYQGITWSCEDTSEDPLQQQGASVGGKRSSFSEPSGTVSRALPIFREEPFGRRISNLAASLPNSPIPHRLADMLSERGGVTTTLSPAYSLSRLPLMNAQKTPTFRSAPPSPQFTLSSAAPAEPKTVNFSATPFAIDKEISDKKKMFKEKKISLTECVGLDKEKLSSSESSISSLPDSPSRELSF